MSLIKNSFSKFSKSDIFRNSAWGIFSNILQTLFVSTFFAITARKFAIDEFANFLIATTVYQLVVAFSSMGLGQWFIREYEHQADKASFTGKFIKLQAYLGFIFYFVNVIIAIVLYDNGQILWLSAVLGINIFFDNLIYSLKNLNIAQEKQKTTFSILIIDGFLKLLIGCVVFFYPISIYTLSILLLIVRFLSLNLFLKLASSRSLTLKGLWKAKISSTDIKHQILLNWRFVIIGSISIIFWRSANIIISKFLSKQDVADYEIAFRIFSIGLILPTIASATIFGKFIKLYNAKKIGELSVLYENVNLIYTSFAFLFYAFIYSFSHVFLPLVFGPNFSGAVACLQEMFLTFLLFPTVLLQANLIVAMKAEKVDMYLNILSLLIMFIACFIGLFYFERSLSVINYSILISFAIFHIIQNIFLIQRKIANVKKCVFFYIFVIGFILSYDYLNIILNDYLQFFGFAAIIISFTLYKIFQFFQQSDKKINPTI